MNNYAWILLAVLGLSVTPVSAFAENAHSYNGAFCKPLLGSQIADFQFGIHLINISDGARTVVCPVVVDEISATSGTSRVYAYVTGSGGFSCTLYSVNRSGSLRQTKSASRNNSGWLYLPDLTTDDYYGSYSMACRLPSFGRLNTIWVGENN